MAILKVILVYPGIVYSTTNYIIHSKYKHHHILINVIFTNSDARDEQSFVKMCLERVMAFQSVVKVDFRL
jgi:hypothetical protein